MTTIQCEAICKSGKRCPRGAKYEGYCKMHRGAKDIAALKSREEMQEALEEIEGLACSDSCSDSKSKSGGSRVRGEGSEVSAGGEVSGVSGGEIILKTKLPGGITRDRRIIIKPIVDVNEAEERERLKKKYKKKKREVYIHPSIVSSIQDFVKDFLKSHPKCPMRSFQNIISTTWKEYKSEMASHIVLNEYQKFMRDNIKLLDDELNHKDKVKRIGTMWNEMKKKKIAVTIRK